MPPTRPASVPETATFDENDSSWEIGARDADDKERKIGAWSYWREDGSKMCEEEWGDGRTRLIYRRFHLDGSVSQSGEKDLVGDVWVGTMRWTRLDGDSPEDRYWPVEGTPNARAYEFSLEDG